MLRLDGNRPARDVTDMLWLLLALAAQLAPVGFSTNGALYTWVEEDAGQVRLMTIDVARGTYNHLPVEAADRAAATAKARVGYYVPAAEAVPGEALVVVRESGRDHVHHQAHTTAWTVRTASGAGTARVTEVPAPQCGVMGAVEPTLTWTAPGGVAVELLADRNPPRWPGCALQWELSEVLAGPRGALVFVMRGIWLEGDVVKTGFTVAGVK